MERAWTEECERLTKQRDYYHDEARHARALVIEQAARIEALAAAARAVCEFYARGYNAEPGDWEADMDRLMLRLDDAVRDAGSQK